MTGEAKAAKVFMADLKNVGLMYLKDDTLKPVRGLWKLPLPTGTIINKVQLLEKSIDKHAAHDHAFAPY